jgi:hypothetical protein
MQWLYAIKLSSIIQSRMLFEILFYSQLELFKTDIENLFQKKKMSTLLYGLKTVKNIINE